MISDIWRKLTPEVVLEGDKAYFLGGRLFDAIAKTYLISEGYQVIPVEKLPMVRSPEVKSIDLYV